MTHLPSLLQKTLVKSKDPMIRVREALQQAEQTGILRMTEPLARAIAEADVIGIQLYGKQLEKYLHVVQTVSPAYADLSPTRRAEPAPALVGPQPQSPSLPMYVVSPATLGSAYAQLTRRLPEGGQEPEWMLEFRLKALKVYESKPMPTWGGDLSQLESVLDEIYFYLRPQERMERSWDDVPQEIKDTFEKLGIPEAERKVLAGVGA